MGFKSLPYFSGVSKNLPRNVQCNLYVFGVQYDCNSLDVLLIQGHILIGCLLHQCDGLAKTIGLSESIFLAYKNAFKDAMQKITTKMHHINALKMLE